MSATTPALHVISIDGDEPFDKRAVLIHADGTLPEQPERARILRFEPDGRGGLIAPGQALDDRWGYLDHTGAWLAEPTYDDARSHSAEGLARIQIGELWGYADRRGAVAIEPAYALAEPFSHGMAAVGAEGRMGYIDVTGRMVVSEQLLRAGAFSAVGLAAVQSQETGKCGFINTSGELVIEPRFTQADAFGPDGVAPVEVEDGGYGLIDREGRWVVEPRYYWIGKFNAYGLAQFTSADLRQSGYLNAAGETVIDGTGEDDMSGGLLVCRTDSGFRFIDAGGAELREADFGNDFTWVGAFSAEGVTLARTDTWGVLHTDGRFIPAEQREPLCEWDGRIPGFADGSGLAPFLAESGDTVYLDAEAREVCRTVVGDGGRTLTLSTLTGTSLAFTAQESVFRTPKPLLARGSRDFFLRPEAQTSDVATIADELIAGEPREFAHYSLVFGSKRDVYDLDDLDEDDLEDDVRTGALEVLAESYIASGPWGEFPFLFDEHESDFSGYFVAAAKQLTARFGEPTHERGDDSASIADSDSDLLNVWQLPDGRQLVLQVYINTGDGDFEFQLWLAAVGMED